MSRVKRGVTSHARHRKVLADIAVHEPAAFQSLVEAASAAAKA
jgi:ribosomal protein L20